MDSDRAYNCAKFWLSKCAGTQPDYHGQHANCAAYVPKPLPTRVLDVGDANEPGHDSLRLLLSSGIVAPYVALSYCWGCREQPGSTSRANISERAASIPMSALGQTIQDAVTATRRLGLRYLWVDALCIIQDDEADKRVEISRMRDIYKDSYVTLVIESADSALKGFLHHRPVSSYPCYRLPYIDDRGARGTLQIRSSRAYSYGPGDYQINVRAWTLEERLISQRKLVYTTQQLRWQCQSAHHEDGGPPTSPGSNQLPEIYLLPFYRLLHGKLPLPAPMEPVPSYSQERADDQYTNSLEYNWLRFVEEYTGRVCTNPKDKLRAFGGIAAEFATRWPADRYVAGLWRDQLHWLLLWTPWPRWTPPVAFSQGQLGQQERKYRAPSWSWAAFGTKVSHILRWTIPRPPRSREPPEYFRILDCDVTLKNSFAPFGEATAACLRVEGYIRRVHVKLRPSVLLGKEPDHDDPYLYALWDQGKHYRYTVGDVDGDPRMSNWLAGLDSSEPGEDREAWCFWVNGIREKTIVGLLLTSVGEGKFRRIGTFTNEHAFARDLSPGSWEDGRNWFTARGREVINII